MYMYLLHLFNALKYQEKSTCTQKNGKELNKKTVKIIFQGVKRGNKRSN